MNTSAIEEWREIPGFTTRYEVSSRGRVRSFAYGEPRMLKAHESRSKTGRLEALRVTLVSPRRIRPVHHLVLEAFVGPRPLGTEGAHGDGDTANNLLGNLRWATHAENIEDRRRHGTTAEGEKQGLAKLTEAGVREIRRSSLTRAQLAAAYGTTVWNIGYVIRRKTWRHVT